MIAAMETDPFTAQESAPPAAPSAPAPAGKAKRKPPTVDPLNPHSVRMSVVGRLVNQSSLKQKGAWGRELSILKRLQKRYPEEAFWLTLTPAEKLDSLCYFVGAYGSAQLKREWDMYQYALAHDRAMIDSPSSVPKMDVPPDEVPPLMPREDLMRWLAD